MKKFLAAGLLAAGMISAPTAHAMPELVLNGSSKVTGVTGLEVDGMTFNITFSASNLNYSQALTDLAISSFFDFGSFSAAQSAAVALQQFFNDQGTAASDMAWSNGNDGIDHDFQVFVSLGATTVRSVLADWTQPIEWSGTDDFNRSQTEQCGNTNPPCAWASFEKVEVTEPATLALFGLGLAGIGFATRRKRKTA